MDTRCETATLPSSEVIGFDRSWSRLVSVVDNTGVERTWHVLDTRPEHAEDRTEPSRGTVLCVHGNPNWSYMWRALAQALPDWRVIAPDALNMGFSERTGVVRRLADRIDDLGALTEALHVRGPVVTVAHDWGGPISLGWAQRNRDLLAGVVLMNTGVGLPDGLRVPPLISLARRTLTLTCRTTPIFLHGAFRMARPQLTRPVYRSYLAPYRSPERRAGIRDFVDDIPIDESHPSYQRLADVAEGMADLGDVPALLLWGSKDVIFSDAFLHDLMDRLPHADVHRFPHGGHQVMEDTDAASVIEAWLDDRFDEAPAAPAMEDVPGPGLATAPPATRTALAATRTDAEPARATAPARPDVDTRPLWSGFDDLRHDARPAIVEMDPADPATVARSITFAELSQQVQATAAALRRAGVGRGDRVATLLPPGIDLMILVYGCLRAGVVVVAPDAALGLAGMRRALASSRPDFVVGDWRGLGLARALRLPARRLSFRPVSGAAAVAAGAAASVLGSDLEPLPEAGQSLAQPKPDGAHSDAPSPDDPAAIVFTSGSTGPSKGVVYTHGQLQAQRDAIRHAFGVRPDDRLVAAFAPFAVLAPALGIPSVVPPMDVTRPAELTASVVAGAAAAIDATMVFASPAVLANIAATADQLDSGERAAARAIRSVVSAGAPVSPLILDAATSVFSGADFFTPYGMTELLPVTAADRTVMTAGVDDVRGVCVGRPLPTVDVMIGAIDTPSGELPQELGPEVLGEVWVRGVHGSSEYDRLWDRTNRAFVDGWHRSGDVGHVDDTGRLWIEGRVAHLIDTAAGVVAPVGVELRAETIVGVERAAAVGVGPPGTQQLAVVLQGASLGSALVAEPELCVAVRAAVDVPVAAILVAPCIPVDRRHNSKVDRTAVQRWAEAVLRGDRPPRL